MRLNGLQLERTASQLHAEAIPDDHPLVAQLNGMFGDHTYFLDGTGLSIVEPAAAMKFPAENAGGMGVVVNLANWTESDPPKLEVHEPELTESTVTFETDGG